MNSPNVCPNVGTVQTCVCSNNRQFWRFEDCLFCNVQQYLQDMCIPCIADSLPFLIIT